MDTKEVIGFVMILALVGILGTVTLYINEKVSDKTALEAGVAASGTLTWSGPSYCGDMINVTNAAGVAVPFYINVTGITCKVAPTQYAVISLVSPANTSNYTATNVTIAMNANASINATMTATNSSAGVTTLTYTALGTTGNSVTTTSTNGTWAAATLSGGLNRDTYYSSSQDVVASVETGWNFTEIVVIAIAAGLIIATIFGVIGGYIRL